MLETIIKATLGTLFLGVIMAIAIPLYRAWHRHADSDSKVALIREFARWFELPPEERRRIASQQSETERKRMKKAFHAYVACSYPKSVAALDELLESRKTDLATVSPESRRAQKEARRKIEDEWYQACAKYKDWTMEPLRAWKEAYEP